MNKRFTVAVLMFSLGLGAFAEEELTEATCKTLRKPGLTMEQMKERFGPPTLSEAEINQEVSTQYRVAFWPRGPENGTNYYYITNERAFQFVALASGKLVYRGCGYRLSEEAWNKLPNHK